MSSNFIVEIHVVVYFSMLNFLSAFVILLLWWYFGQPKKSSQYGYEYL